MNAVPDSFAHTTVELYGAAGAEWLRRLPSALAGYSQQWSLRVMPPFEPLSYSYVMPATRNDRTDVVLKVHFPDLELITEIEALRLYDGHGAVQLLDTDPEQGILLLERLMPGTPLTSVADDEQATSVAVQVIRQLWKPAPPEHPFPTVADWADGLKRMRE